MGNNNPFDGSKINWPQIDEWLTNSKSQMGQADLKKSQQAGLDGENKMLAGWEEKESVLTIQAAMRFSSIEFAQWITSEGWIQWHDNPHRWVSLHEGKTIFTTDQLYTKYLNR